MADDNPENKDNEAARVKRRPPHLFKPGQSGNPGGRPRSAQFRDGCRRAAEIALAEIERRLRESPGTMSLRELLEIFGMLADRGGYLSAEKLALAEVARGKIWLEALAIETLTKEQRDRLIARLQLHENETLGLTPAQDHQGEQDASGSNPCALGAVPEGELP